MPEKTYKIELELTAEEISAIEDLWYPERDDHPIFKVRKKVFMAIGDFLK